MDSRAKENGGLSGYELDSENLNSDFHFIVGDFDKQVTRPLCASVSPMYKMGGILVLTCRVLAGLKDNVTHAVFRAVRGWLQQAPS